MTVALVAILSATISATAKPGVEALRSGDRIRVLAPEVIGSKASTGTFEGVTEDKLTLRVTGEPAMLTIPLDKLRALQVRRVVGNHKKRGALLGIVPWATLVGIAVADAGFAESGFVSVTSGVFLLGGILLGAKIGAGIEKSEWQEVRLSASEEVSDEVRDRVSEEYSVLLRAHPRSTPDDPGGSLSKVEPVLTQYVQPRGGALLCYDVSVIGETFTLLGMSPSGHLRFIRLAR